MRKKVLLVLSILALSILIYPSVAISSGQTIDPNESHAWYILNQVDTQSLMVGLPQRLGKAVMSTERQTPMWLGVDNGGGIELEIKVEGKKTGQIFIGFFTNPRWWVEPPKQIRSFPGQGTYKVERLIPGKYYIGAMIGSLPVPDALGVDNFWPESVQIKQGESTKVKLLLSDEFQGSPSVGQTGIDIGYAGQFEVTYPEQLITLQTLDENDAPAPFCRVIFVDRIPGNPSQVNLFHESGTDEKGYAYIDKFSGPFTFNVQRFDFIPENFAQRSQYMRLEELHYTKDQKVITFKWPAFPTGTGKVKGRIHNQYGKPLKEYYISIDHDIKGSAQGTGDYYEIRYKIPVTNPEGRFEINDLPAGKYTVMVRAFDYPTHVRNFNMGEFTITDEPDSITEFVLEVEAKELFYGKAFYQDGGTPLDRGGWLALFEEYTPEQRQMYAGQRGRSFSYRIDPDGFFRVTLSKKEIEDLTKCTGGNIEISDSSGTIGKVHIDKLSKDPKQAPSFYFPRGKPKDSLVGLPLPELKNIKADFDINQAQDKKMLICFFDIEQRPSRNSILQLSKRADDLAQKGISIIAINVSEIEQNTPDVWLRENNITIPVGIVEGDSEQTRFNWGVKALPWLILTDKNHIVTDEGFSVNELDTVLSKDFEPDTILEHMKAADAAMAKGFTATGTGSGQWTVTMGQDSCIIVEKLRSSFPTPEDIIKDNQIPVLRRRVEPVDVNSRPLRAIMKEQRITYFDPNCSARKDCLKTYKLTSEEKVEKLGEHASIHFEKPDSPSYSMPYRMYVWSLGRGFSKYINEITSVIQLPNGNLKCEATMRDYDNDSRNWEFVVDPAKEFFITSATYFRNSKPYYIVDVNETLQFGDMFFARKTSWNGPSGKVQIIYESIELKPDLNLIKSVNKELFGSYTTSADVHDETGYESIYHRKKIGETHRLVYISLLDRKLPNIYGLCSALEPEKLKNKNILVCFFDYEQRPSRNCILELNKKIKKLNEKDIEIAAIHASKIEQEYLDKWLKENKIDFPVGILQENAEQIRFNYGVKALPWLILTNKEHIVTDEGFNINELDGKTKKITDK